MAGVIIRKRRSVAGNSITGNNNDAGATLENAGAIIEPGITTTGEPDTDDIGPTNNDNVTDSGTAGNGSQFVDPTSSTGGSSAGTPKRRGRKPGSTGTRSRTSATQATTDISSILLTLHFAVSKMLKDETWKLSEDEASELGKAITRVSQLYDIQIIPEKQMAWLNLIMVGSAIYGPRIMQDRPKKDQPEHATIDMPTPIVS